METEGASLSDQYFCTINRGTPSGLSTLTGHPERRLTEQRWGQDSESPGRGSVQPRPTPPGDQLRSAPGDQPCSAPGAPCSAGLAGPCNVGQAHRVKELMLLFSLQINANHPRGGERKAERLFSLEAQMPGSSRVYAQVTILVVGRGWDTLYQRVN